MFVPCMYGPKFYFYLADWKKNVSSVRNVDSFVVKVIFFLKYMFDDHKNLLIITKSMEYVRVTLESKQYLDDK